MLVEFWLADRLGRAWLRLRPSLQPTLSELPGECLRVARGERLSARRLWRAQDFAVRVWWRTGMTAFLLGCIGAAVALAVSRGRVGTDVSVASVLVGGGLAGLAMTQMAWIRYRSNQNRRSWAAAGLSAEEEPLPGWSEGRPRSSDFWLILLLGGALFLILLYAGTRSGHH
jgi:hypothetical protein